MFGYGRNRMLQPVTCRPLVQYQHLGTAGFGAVAAAGACYGELAAWTVLRELECNSKEQEIGGCYHNHNQLLIHRLHTSAHTQGLMPIAPSAT